jgi:hypothetical protein
MIRPGSPCIIRLQGQRLGFRMDDCVHVPVKMSGKPTRFFPPVP